VGKLAWNEAVSDHWFFEKGVSFIKAHPSLTIVNGFRKLWAAFSVLPSPRRSFWPTLVYAFSYGPVLVLGLVGMVMTCSQWRQHSIIYVLFLAFAMVTVVFWGHTSHRSFLDVYLIIYAAYLYWRLADMGIRPDGQRLAPAAGCATMR
jgi:hypothetical protein